MMYFGMEPSLSLGAKMALTAFELKRIREGKLKGCSYEVPNGFKCVSTYHGNKKNLGIFDTVEECNAAYDDFEIKKAVENLNQRLRARGYGESKYNGQVKYVVKLEDGTHKSFDDKEAARAKYESIIANEIKELEARLSSAMQ